MHAEEMALLARTLASEKSHIGRENELVCHSISDKTIFLKKKKKHYSLLFQKHANLASQECNDARIWISGLYPATVSQFTS